MYTGKSRMSSSSTRGSSCVSASLASVGRHSRRAGLSATSHRNPSSSQSASCIFLCIRLCSPSSQPLLPFARFFIGLLFTSTAPSRQTTPKTHTNRNYDANLTMPAFPERASRTAYSSIADEWQSKAHAVRGVGGVYGDTNHSRTTKVPSQMARGWIRNTPNKPGASLLLIAVAER